MERAYPEERSRDTIIVCPRGLLVSLSGIDGAGKSTIVYQLRELLSIDYGISIRYVWCKFGDHPFSKCRLSRLLGREQARRPQFSYAPSNRPPAAFRLYGLALLAFHLGRIALSVRRPVQSGHVVLCDRYIFDTMVDLQQDLHFSVSRVRGVLGARWIPQPDCKVLLDLEAETAFVRKADSTSVEYLQERRTMYLDIARKYGLTVVDASQPIETTTQLVLEQIRIACALDEGTN
jgi:dTMP kinase